MGERLGACICAEVMSLPVLTKQNIILIDRDNKSRRVHVQEWRLITCQVTPAKWVFAASFVYSKMLRPQDTVLWDTAELALDCIQKCKYFDFELKHKLKRKCKQSLKMHTHEQEMNLI